jgi:hypothetical protein
VHSGPQLAVRIGDESNHVTIRRSLHGPYISS